MTVEILTVDEAVAVMASRARRAEVIDEDPSGCWLVKAPGPNGTGAYACFYEAAFGPAPPGFTVVHLCTGRTRGCVRPSHLDVVPEGSRVEHIADPALAVEDRSSFAARLRDEREAMGLSRTDFGRLLGVSPRTVESWEQTRNAPAGSMVAAIAKRFGWDADPQPFTVTVVVQRVVRAKGAGAAAREVLEQLRQEEQPLRAHVYSVNRAGAARGSSGSARSRRSGRPPRPRG